MATTKKQRLDDDGYAHITDSEYAVPSSDVPPQTGAVVAYQPNQATYWWNNQPTLSDNAVFAMFRNMAYKPRTQIGAPPINDETFTVPGMVAMETVIDAFRAYVVRVLHFPRYEAIIRDARDLNFSIVIPQSGNGRRSTIKKACVQCNIEYAEITMANYRHGALTLISDYVHSGRPRDGNTPSSFVLLIDDFEKLCIERPQFHEEYTLLCESPLVNGPPARFWIVLCVTGDHRNTDSTVVTLAHKACHNDVVIPAITAEAKSDFLIKSLSMSDIECNPTAIQLTDLRNAVRGASLGDVLGFAGQIAMYSLGQLADARDEASVTFLKLGTGDPRLRGSTHGPDTVMSGEAAGKLSTTSSKNVFVIRAETGLKMFVNWRVIEMHYLQDMSTGLVCNVIPTQ